MRSATHAAMIARSGKLQTVPMTPVKVMSGSSSRLVQAAGSGPYN